MNHSIFTDGNYLFILFTVKNKISNEYYFIVLYILRIIIHHIVIQWNTIFSVFGRKRYF